EGQDGEARNLTFDDKTFDLVVSGLVLHHLPPAERRKALSEICRVLKSGGQIIVLELFRGDEYVKGFQELGMTKVRLTTSKSYLFFGICLIQASKPLIENG